MPSRSRSRSRSRSGRSRSPEAKSRSRSRSRGYRGGGRRDHSRSPMSSRRRHQGTRENPLPTRCLGVFGLSLYTTEKELEKEFGRFGNLERVQVVLDGHSGRSRGFAFIYFDSVDEAEEAREKMNGIELDGKKIRVDYSITKRAHTPTPGMYMGRPTAASRRERSRDRSRDRDYRGDYYRRSPSPAYRRRRSPSPYYRDSRRSYRSRSRSYSPRRRGYSPRRRSFSPRRH